MCAEPVAAPPAPEYTPEPDSIERRYRDDIIAAFNRLTLHGLPEARHDVSGLALEEVFVRLSFRLRGERRTAALDEDEPRAALKERGPTSRRRVDEERTRMLRFEAPRPGRDAEERSRPVGLAEALGRAPHLAIVGAPGSGKTTLTRWLALSFARAKQGDADRLGPAFRHPRLPVVVELRRLVRWIKEPGRFPGPDGLAPQLADYITDDPRFHGGVRDRLLAALRRGGCFLLIDGLDEVADSALRARIVESIAALVRDPAAGGNLIVVTGRPASFEGVSLGPGFRTAEVRPFEPKDVRDFLRYWYRTAYGPAHEAEAGKLAEGIEARDRVRDLAINPLLCTVIAVVYHDSRVLPNRRVDLYEKCCEVLLETWERAKEGGGEDLGLIGTLETSTQLTLLGEVAYALHAKGEGGFASKDEVCNLIWPSLKRLRNLSEAGARSETSTFVNVIQDRTGLLQDRGDGTLEFPHRAFQEYLAARHIAAQQAGSELLEPTRPHLLDLVMPHLHEAWWREVHLLVLGRLGRDAENAPRAARLITAILDHTPKPCLLLRLRPTAGGLFTTILDRKLKLRLLFGGRFRNKRLPFIKMEMQVVLVLALYGMFFVGLYTTLSVVLEIGELLAAVMSLFFSGLAMVPEMIRAPLRLRQLNHQIGWLLDRDLELALRGFADAKPEGRDAATGDWLRRELAEFVQQCLYDRAWHYQQLAILTEDIRDVVDARIVEILLRPLADRGEDADVRQWAALWSGQAGAVHTCMVEAVLRVLADWGDDPAVRGMAALGLGQAGAADARVVEALLRVLPDQCDASGVRGAAAESLGKVGAADARVVEALLRVLADRSDWYFVRGGAAWGLRRVGAADARVVDALLQVLARWFEDVDVQEQAVLALGQARAADTRVVDRILALTHDRHPHKIRVAALQALAECKPDEKRLCNALRRIGRCLHDSPDLRQHALRAAARLLEGRPLPGSRWVPLAERARRRKVRLRWAAGVFGVAALAGLLFTGALAVESLGPQSSWVVAATLAISLASLGVAVAALPAFQRRSKPPAV